MTAEDECLFSEDDEADESPDDLAGRITLLKDVMSSYDLSFMMDIRDPIYMSKLGEAVGALGIRLELSAEPPTVIGDGLFESISHMAIRYGMEVAEYSYRSVSSDPALAMILAARGVLSMASLINPVRGMDTKGAFGLTIA